ncbi:MAG TPA: winged helix DNA-binding domain-containing protein [Ignavibacteriaceae bacterium]|nr:winged helix DNA-binding domain-containing protein [Ignavibacteriaceae bacterium]
MNLKEIAYLRLINQQVARTKFNYPKEIVSWMGAIQAQDYAMAKWAIGLRLQGSAEKEIEAAFNKGEILRTHLLRPTWHFISPEDIYWMLELTAPHIKRSLNTRRKWLELDRKTMLKSEKIIMVALNEQEHLTRDEIFNFLEIKKIAIKNQRGVHILLEAELDGLICSGRIKGNQRTYALLEERVPKKKILPREEALAELSQRYFLSHGPAVLQDFAWWSGLPVKDARMAIESLKKNFISERIGSQVYWFDDSISFPDKLILSAYLLPAYDEFLISYKDRTASLELEHHKKTVSSNGIFRPAIVINGKIAGIWKKITKGDEIIIELNLFSLQNKSTVKSLKIRSEELGKFFEMDTRLLIEKK